MPALARHEHRGELRFARVAGEQIARRLRVQWRDGRSDEGPGEQ
jgi:hypothetical protein